MSITNLNLILKKLIVYKIGKILKGNSIYNKKIQAMIDWLEPI